MADRVRAVDPRLPNLHSSLMSRYHLVRVGAMGQVGRFAAVDAVRYPRHSRVIVRTRRGLEMGDVLRRPTIATMAARLPTATFSAA